MQSAQDHPVAVPAGSGDLDWAEQERRTAGADPPPGGACAAGRAGGLPLRRGVVTLEHWLDLNA